MTARIVDAATGMDEAVSRLRAGLLVAFPTETVYGLGADARNPDAVARIFAAKGRPATNPLIVHVADVDGAKAVAASWPDVAGTLAFPYWPGPLTLVLPVGAGIALAVTAGGATVGVRVPDHPVALELLQRSGLALAAPSANRSEEVSPTTAAHVADSLGPWVDDLLILDGGPCAVGIESTVLDITVTPPRLLRPGRITLSTLRDVIGEVADGPGDGPARAPGQMPRHYAPRAPVVLIDDFTGFTAQPGDGILRCLDVQIVRPLNIAALPGGGGFCARVYLPRDPNAYAQRLYHSLRSLDAVGATRIVIEMPPPGGEWDAVRDRLRRAAAPKPEGNAPTDAPVAISAPEPIPSQYVPRAPVVLTTDILATVIHAGEAALYCLDLSLQSQGNVFVVPLPGGGFYFLTYLPDSPHGYARQLDKALQALDDSGVSRIVVQVPPPPSPFATVPLTIKPPLPTPLDAEWEAVRARLRHLADAPKADKATTE